jgi:NAD(P)H dehydrogenase (quinone)
MKELLVVYYSVHGATRALADSMADGIAAVPGAQPRLRTVPKVAPVTQVAEPPVPPTGAPYATHDDLVDCIGYAFGSPTRFGLMAAPLKYFLDGTAGLWSRHALSGRPACVFTSTGSPHGGQEATLLSMMLPLLHHGLLIVGLPYSEAGLWSTQGGGSPYGASHLAGADSARALDAGERRLAFAQGRRLAELALKLAAP